MRNRRSSVLACVAVGLVLAWCACAFLGLALGRAGGAGVALSWGAVVLASAAAGAFGMAAHELVGGR